MRITDKHVGYTCLIAAVWLIGVEMGEAQPVKTILACPEHHQGERLVSITHDSGKTSCRYLPAPKGRVLITRS
jgi:hypothetical protein